ncbi:hypothetical protein AB4Y45_34120 [Paraburkholderia sp. EG287A]|uniref:hypothetical protein n=1 Tax=Paraburkholderia sp. EG287A TaxID=3237012 RepID=UPI0034D35DEB
MTHKVSVIGGGELPAPSSAGQNSGLPRRPRVNAIESSAPAMLGAVPVVIPAVPVSHTVARMTQGVAPVAQSTGHHAKPAAMSGDVRMVSVSLTELKARFPAEPEAMLERVRVVLAGVSPDRSAVNWLSYGLDTQGSLKAVLAEQVQLFEATAPREAEALLTRLHRILADVLDAFEGGFFRKAPRVLWQQYTPEVGQIESRLGSSVSAIRGLLVKLATLAGKRKDAFDELRALDMAGQYLLEGLGHGDAAQLLQSRLSALLASQALAEENRLQLEQHEGGLKALVLHVQDGMFVQLAAVASQILALPDKPNETERFLAREALSELTQLFARSK